MTGMDITRHPDTWTDATLFADDLRVGTVYDLGSHPVTVEELVSFADQWDPQFFHVDEDAATSGAFGGLIASGIHTLAVLQRLSVSGFWSRCATVAARGIRDARFLRPVRPDAVLTGRLVVEDVHHRDPCRSLVTVSSTLEDEARIAVLTMTLDVYVARRRGSGAR